MYEAHRSGRREGHTGRRGRDIKKETHKVGRREGHKKEKRKGWRKDISGCFLSVILSTCHRLSEICSQPAGSSSFRDEFS